MFQMTAETVNFLARSSAMGPLYWTFCSECIQPWIWNDGSPWILSPRHYSINKYSFSFSPSSSIFSSIMAEVTAVKALYPLMFISRWGCGSLPNYEITEGWVWIFCSMCFLILCWVCVYSQNKTSPTHPPPFLFRYMDKSFHWILLSCKNKNDPQMLKNYSGTIQCSICQSSQRQSVRKKIRINEEKSIPAQVVLLPVQLG